MTKMRTLICLLCLSAFLAGCASTGANSKTGWALVSTFTESQLIASGTVEATKKGTACSQSIAGIHAYGDSSIKAAIKNGSITEIAYVDSEYTNILALYGKHCTIVTGN